jgi:hypothetical protein
MMNVLFLQRCRYNGTLYQKDDTADVASDMDAKSLEEQGIVKILHSFPTPPPPLSEEEQGLVTLQDELAEIIENLNSYKEKVDSIGNDSDILKAKIQLLESMIKKKDQQLVDLTQQVDQLTEEVEKLKAVPVVIKHFESVPVENEDKDKPVDSVETKEKVVDVKPKAKPTSRRTVSKAKAKPTSRRK